MQQTYPHLKSQCCRLKTQVSENTLQKILDNAELNNSDVYPAQDTALYTLNALLNVLLFH